MKGTVEPAVPLKGDIGYDSYSTKLQVAVALFFRGMTSSSLMAQDLKSRELQLAIDFTEIQMPVELSLSRKRRTSAIRIKLRCYVLFQMATRRAFSPKYDVPNRYAIACYYIPSTVVVERTQSRKLRSAGETSPFRQAA